MTEVVLNLFGPVSPADAADSPIYAIRSSKARALAIFLVLEHGAHPREQLAPLLWGDVDESSARTSLRQAIKQLRDVFGERVTAERDLVELTGPVRCDVRDFLQACEHDPAAAVAFPVDRFMSGIIMPRAQAFEEWIDHTRANLVQRHTAALRITTRDLMASFRWREAITLASSWLQREPSSAEAARIVAYAERAAAGEPVAQSIDTRGPDFRAGLVGREREWRTLTGVWADLKRGAGSVVLLEGEAELGSTRLADEWLAWVRAHGGTVVRGRGYDAAAGVPFGPIVDALRDAIAAPGFSGAAPEHLAEISRLIPELRRTVPVLRDVTPVAEHADVGHSRLFEAIAQVFLALADEQPTILWIDDLHRCDAGTCSLVHFLVQRVAAGRIVLLFAVHPGEVARESAAGALYGELRARIRATIVKLDSLSENDIARLVRQLGRLRSQDGAIRLSAGLHAATDGNPGHLIEMLRALVLDGSIGVHPETGEWFEARANEPVEGYNVPMPVVVRDGIRHRVGGLPELSRDVIATVAVVGTGCDPGVIARIHDVSRLHAAALCDELIERRLLREEDGRYVCAHPVITNVVRAELTTPRRREIHRAVASALAAVAPDATIGEAAAEIARHAQRAQDRPMTHRFALLASADAVQYHAIEEALLWLEVAGRAAEPGEQADVVRQRLAEVCDLAARETGPRAVERRRSTGGFGKLELDLS